MGSGATVAWEVEGVQPKLLQGGSISLEKTLEDWIERRPDLLERGLVVLARQMETDGGPLDLLCLDRRGRLVVVELKRNEAYRDAVAQVLDYTARVAAMSYDELKRRVDENRRARGMEGSFGELLGKVLGTEAAAWSPDKSEPRIVIGGTGADSSLRGIVEFLDRYGVPVNGVFFDPFVSGAGATLLVRSSVVEDEHAAEQGKGRTVVTPEELLAGAEKDGVRALVDPVLDAWRAATGCPLKARHRRWVLPSPRDGRCWSAQVFPYDDNDPTKRAWLQIDLLSVAADLALTEDQVKSGITAAGATLVADDHTAQFGWLDLTTPSLSEAAARWIQRSYASRSGAR